jgi:hypothetical protein
MLAEWIDTIQRQAATTQERDEIVWSCMAQLHGKNEDRDDCEWGGGRPRNFAEVGKAMRAGRSWAVAWGDWLHWFVDRKDARCLAAEPPSWFSAERRAMMAGVAEFFARVYWLPKPPWVHRPDYFLAEMEYMAYLVSEPADPEFLAWPPGSEDELYRMNARSPNEMLRRNVIFEARGLTVL